MPTTANKYKTARDKGAPLWCKILDEQKVESYLSIVLAENYDDYVCWWFNHQDGGFFWGHYFRKDCAENAEALARADFDERVQKNNRL